MVAWGFRGIEGAKRAKADPYSVPGLVLDYHAQGNVACDAVVGYGFTERPKTVQERMLSEQDDIGCRRGKREPKIGVDFVFLRVTVWLEKTAEDAWRADRFTIKVESRDANQVDFDHTAKLFEQTYGPFRTKPKPVVIDTKHRSKRSDSKDSGDSEHEPNHSAIFSGRSK